MVVDSGIPGNMGRAEGGVHRRRSQCRKETPFCNRGTLLKAPAALGLFFGLLRPSALHEKLAFRLDPVLVLVAWKSQGYDVFRGEEVGAEGDVFVRETRCAFDDPLRLGDRCFGRYFAAGFAFATGFTRCVSRREGQVSRELTALIRDRRLRGDDRFCGNVREQAAWTQAAPRGFAATGFMELSFFLAIIFKQNSWRFARGKRSARKQAERTSADTSATFSRKY